MYRQEYFNRHNIIDLLTALSNPDTQLYLAVDVLESMRVTSVDEAVEDKISVYNRYVNHTLKYVKAAKIRAIENIVREFLIKHCTVAENNPAVPLDELMNQCFLHDPVTVTSAKCVFSFLYMVTIMKRIEVPSFQMLFSPYSLERFRCIDVLPVSADEKEYYMYFQLDLQKPTEIIGTVMGAYSVHLCLYDVHRGPQYYISIVDEECFIADYTDDENTLRLLNDVCKGAPYPFMSCSSAASQY